MLTYNMTAMTAHAYHEHMPTYNMTDMTAHAYHEHMPTYNMTDMTAHAYHEHLPTYNMTDMTAHAYHEHMPTYNMTDMTAHAYHEHLPTYNMTDMTAHAYHEHLPTYNMTAHASPEHMPTYNMTSHDITCPVSFSLSPAHLSARTLEPCTSTTRQPTTLNTDTLFLLTTYIQLPAFITSFVHRHPRRILSRFTFLSPFLTNEVGSRGTVHLEAVLAKNLA